MTTFIGWVIGLIIGAVVLLGIFYVIVIGTSFSTPSSGIHVGYVTSVEQNGIFWKTWSAYVKTNTTSTQEDQYCVTDPSIVSELQEAANTTSNVEIHYSNGLFMWPWDCTGGDESIIVQVTSAQ
jgi:hypothetical protein